MTTPLLEVLARAYPEASITYIVGSWSKVVPEHCPEVNRVIDCGTVGIAGRYRLSEYLQLAWRLRRFHFDLAFVLDRSPMMTLLPWLAGIPRRVGPDSQGRGFSLTDRVTVSKSPERLEHQADIYLDLARALGLPVEHPRMHFLPTSGERSTVSTQIGSSRTRIAVFPGGGSNPGMELGAKRWPVDRYRELIVRFVGEQHAFIVLLGGPDDAAIAQALLDGLEIPEDALLNLVGKTSFGEMAAQLEYCDLFIGNDSSPMHLAAAVGTPVIALFGPTSPQEYGPYPLDDPKHVALWHNPYGQPCFFLGKMRESHHCTCMQAVSIDEVWSAVQHLLERAQSTDHQEVPGSGGRQ